MRASHPQQYNERLQYPVYIGSDILDLSIYRLGPNLNEISFKWARCVRNRTRMTPVAIA